MSEAQRETVNTLHRDLHNDSDHMTGPENNSSNDDEPSLLHLHKKARTTHAPVSSLQASLDNVNSVDSNTMNSSTDHSNDSKAPEKSQSSRIRSHLEEGSSKHTPSEEHVAEVLQDVSKDGPSVDKGRRRHSSPTYYARYRQSGANLMTKHMFTGKKVGKRVLYVPVYKRNSHGRLLKLKKTRPRHWKYVEVSELSEEETEGGLKITEEP